MTDTTGTAGEATGPLTQDAAALEFEKLIGDGFDDPPADDEGEAGEEAAEVADEPEGDEPDGEAQDEEEGSDEEPAGEDDDALIPVKVDGKTEKVTLDELKKGYSRTKDYTQKTMDLAAKRKAVESVESELAAERAKLADLAKVVGERLAAAGDPEPNWDELRRDDPVEWAIQKQVWAEKRAEADRLEGLQRALNAKNAETAALLDKMPAWKKDAERMKKDMAAIQEFAATELGFTPDELSNIYDHRAVLALHDAMRFRQMVKKQAQLETSGKVQKVTNAPKTLTPAGSTGKPTKAAVRRDAIERASKTGRVDDAANAFAKLGIFG